MSMYIRACTIPAFQAGKEELKCKFSALKVIVLGMECKSGCHEWEKSSSVQRPFATLD